MTPAESPTEATRAYRVLDELREQRRRILDTIRRAGIELQKIDAQIEMMVQQIQGMEGAL